MDVDGLLLGHERLWEQRAAVLREWRAAVGRRERVAGRLQRQRVARDAALARAGRGLTARQQAWAEQHADYENRPRDREGRQVVVTWTYHRKRIETATTKWAAAIAATTTALGAADQALAQATAAVLNAWGKEAAQATGRTQRQLKALARQRPPSH